jgi:hypothetical protein
MDGLTRLGSSANLSETSKNRRFRSLAILFYKQLYLKLQNLDISLVEAWPEDYPVAVLQEAWDVAVRRLEAGQVGVDLLFLEKGSLCLIAGI